MQRDKAPAGGGSDRSPQVQVFGRDLASPKLGKIFNNVRAVRDEVEIACCGDQAVQEGKSLRPVDGLSAPRNWR